MIKLITALAALACTSAAAAITVDGSYDAAYGAATATVAYNPAAPQSNFGTPTNESAAIAYSIYLNASDGFVYVYLRANPATGGSSAGTFANLYFDLDPAGANGSDIGFELSPTTHNVFIPGLSGPIAASGITVAASADGLGLEAAIANSNFTTAYPGLTYYPTPLAAEGGPVTLRLSQSFGYSFAGGAEYGVDRLGSVILSTVPEPATWGLMIAGFGLIGVAARRRRTSVAA